MNNQSIKSLDILKGSEVYLVIGVTSKYTTEVLNLSTMEEETIEGDYTDNGDLSHLDLRNVGNYEIYLESLPEKSQFYKDKVNEKANYIIDFYLS